MKLKCPKCGGMIFTACLTSNPAQYECGCQRCDFILCYYNRKDSFQLITQDELNAYYDENKDL